MAEVTPLFPGQTGLTPGRRAELERAAGAPAAPPVATVDEGDHAVPGLLAQLRAHEAEARVEVESAAPAPGQPPEPVAELQQALAAFNVNALVSPDEQTRQAAQRQLAELTEHAYRVDQVFDGVENLVRGAFPARLADRVMQGMAAPQVSPVAAASITGAQAQVQAQAYPQQGGGGSGGAIDSLVRAPFTMLAAGGSLAMQALRKSAATGAAAGHRVADAVRKSSFDIIGQQVNSLHADIVREAQWLRAHGMDGVVDEMKASGKPLSEAVAGLERGGPLEQVGLRFKGLMTDPEFKQRYEGLQGKLGKFGDKLRQYVKGGVALGHDMEGPAEEMVGGVTDATEGFPLQKKGGGFGLMSERMHEIIEKIREMIHNLMRRLAPGKE